MEVLKKALNDVKTIVFYDLEATQFSQEIIAIGAIKVTIDNKLQINKKFNSFKAYVKSKEKVGPIVENLTGITDNFLKTNGLNFVDAFSRFEKYIGNINEPIRFMSYGSFDIHLIKTVMNNTKDNPIPLVKKILGNYIDFCNIFRNFIRSNKNETLSLLDALKVLKVTPFSRAHDPSVDAKNLMLLYDAFLKNKKIVKDHYSEIIKRYNNIPSPLYKTLNKLYKNGVVTIDEFNAFIEEEL